MRRGLKCLWVYSFFSWSVELLAKDTERLLLTISLSSSWMVAKSFFIGRLITEINRGGATSVTNLSLCILAIIVLEVEGNNRNEKWWIVWVFLTMKNGLWGTTFSRFIYSAISRNCLLHTLLLQDKNNELYRPSFAFWNKYREVVLSATKTTLVWLP